MRKKESVTLNISITKQHSLFEKWVAMAEMEKGYARPRKLCIKEKMMESYRL